MSKIVLRPLRSTDPELISAAFAAIGWSKPVRIYENYLVDQAQGQRDVLVAELEGKFVGYLTVYWDTADGVPEVMDLNVLPDFRRRGITTQMMDEAERRVAQRCWLNLPDPSAYLSFLDRVLKCTQRGASLANRSKRA